MIYVYMHLLVCVYIFKELPVIEEYISFMQGACNICNICSQYARMPCIFLE